MLSVCIYAEMQGSRNSSEWVCGECTYHNREENIECEMCSNAPWKQQIAAGLRLPVRQSSGIWEGFRSPEQPDTKWTCRACTLKNEVADRACNACGTAREAAAQSRPATGSRLAPNAVVADRPAGVDRAPSPGRIVGTLSQATQTDQVGCPATNIFGRLRNIVRKSPSSSRDHSPGLQAPQVQWIAGGDRAARWTCSQCTAGNTMDTTQCESCGYDEPTPNVKFSG